MQRKQVYQTSDRNAEMYTGHIKALMWMQLYVFAVCKKKIEQRDRHTDTTRCFTLITMDVATIMIRRIDDGTLIQSRSDNHNTTAKQHYRTERVC